jgi:taurine dioxygenase
VREQPDRPIPEIFVVSNVTEKGIPIGALGNEEIAFHSDLSYLPTPGTLSLLYALEVPERGGETMWANCYLAYESLEPSLRARVEGLRAAHFHPRPQQNPKDPAVHPIVRTHPETGRKSLYVNPHFTRYVEGLSAGESGELLDALFAQVCSPRFVWMHHWRPGDLVMWDNRCTLHRRNAFDNHSRRLMKRTQILGEPVY